MIVDRRPSIPVIRRIFPTNHTAYLIYQIQYPGVVTTTITDLLQPAASVAVIVYVPNGTSPNCPVLLFGKILGEIE